MESVIATTEHILAALPRFEFSTATWFIVGILGFSVWMFFRASKDPKSPIRWEHMVVDSATNRTSPYKLGFLIGVIVSTWIVITMLDTNSLGLDILGAYLTYLVGGAGFSEWLKHGQPSKTKSPSSDVEDGDRDIH